MSKKKYNFKKHTHPWNPFIFPENPIIFMDPNTKNSINTSPASNGFPKTIENIIFGSFVTKKRLTPIVFETFSNTAIAQAEEVNIFIDLYSVLHSIFSAHYSTAITDTTALTSGVINMCGHYRSFFRGLGVKTKFFLVYSGNFHEINKRLCFGYNAAFEPKTKIDMFQRVAELNFSILDVLCPYLPDIHFIRSKSNYEVAVMIAYIIEHLNDGLPNIIISKDFYPIQLCTKYPFTSYIFPYKRYLYPHERTSDSKTADESFMVPLIEKPSHNVAFWNLIAEKRKVRAEMLYPLKTCNFIMLSALWGFPERGLVAINGTNVVQSYVKWILQLGGDQIQITPEHFAQDPKLKNELPIALIENRYRALDIGFMLSHYRADLESKMIKIQNLDDNGTINLINARYFNDNPINILNL